MIGHLVTPVAVVVIGKVAVPMNPTPSTGAVFTTTEAGTVATLVSLLASRTVLEPPALDAGSTTVSVPEVVCPPTTCWAASCNLTGAPLGGGTGVTVSNTFLVVRPSCAEMSVHNLSRGHT